MHILVLPVIKIASNRPQRTPVVHKIIHFMYHRHLVCILFESHFLLLTSKSIHRLYNFFNDDLFNHFVVTRKR